MSFSKKFDGNTMVVLDMELHIDEVFIAYFTGFLNEGEKLVKHMHLRNVPWK